jgi:hypothetical protein
MKNAIYGIFFPEISISPQNRVVLLVLSGYFFSLRVPDPYRASRMIGKWARRCVGPARVIRPAYGRLVANCSQHSSTCHQDSRVNDLFAQMNTVIVPGPFCDSLIRLPILLTGRDYKDNEE